MDLQTIRESVQQKKYHSREEFLADIKQVGLVSHVPGVSISVAHFLSVSISVLIFRVFLSVLRNRIRRIRYVF